jgi:phospholipase/carboxylesterase
MPITTSSSLAPKSGGAPKQLVLLLHGYGSNGADLISFAPHWQRGLPDALFLAPDAPERSHGWGGFQWWALSSIEEQALAAGAARAGPVLDAYIDQQLETLGLTEAELAIVGFSQGTMIALHVGLRRQRPVAGIVGYSGMLTGAPSLAHTQISKPPVLLVHGSADPVVPVVALHHAKAELQRLGLEVTAHVSPGVGHSVDPIGLRMGGDFVKRVLGGTPR